MAGAEVDESDDGLLDVLAAVAAEQARVAAEQARLVVFASPLIERQLTQLLL